jgi:hypothetical protein
VNIATLGAAGFSWRQQDKPIGEYLLLLHSEVGI